MGKLIGIIIIGLVAVAGGVALRGQIGGGGNESLVLCEAHPNPASHDQEFKFFLDLNGKNKNAAKYEIESVSVSDNGIALNSNAEKLKLIGPFHDGLLDTVTVGKNTIGITPIKDTRDEVEQAVLLHVAVRLRDKKQKTTTTTSAICQTTIIHAPDKVVIAPPVAQPKPKPPILIKDKEGSWVEPKKPSAAPPAAVLTKTPSFDSHYDVGVTDGITAIGIGITPQDAVGRKFVRIEIPLVNRNYTFGTPTRTSANLNQNGWYSSDWNCSVANNAVNCQGATPLATGVKTPIVIELPSSIGAPPAYINVNIYDDQGEKIGLGVEYQSGSVL